VVTPEKALRRSQSHIEGNEAISFISQEILRLDLQWYGKCAFNKYMTNAPTPNNKKARRKMWSSDIARQQHNAARRRLVREAADREAKSLSNARTDLLNAERRLRLQEANRRLNMVGGGMTPRLRAVMNSWGLALPLNITPAREVSAYTDFKQITVNYDQRLAPDEFGRGPKIDLEAPVNEEELRQIAAELRGAFYHELGHNLFTTPLRDLVIAGVAEGWTPPDSIELGSNNKWTWDRGFQQAWNVLEDQRMEMAVVMESPQIAAYLTVLVMRLIVRSYVTESTWLLVAGRRYLPADIRKKCRDRWTEGDPSASADEVLKVVYTYMTADSATDMLNAVLKMKDLLGSVIARTIDEHGEISKEGDPSSSEKTIERIQQVNSRIKSDDNDEEQDAPEPQKSSQQNSDAEDSDSEDSDSDGSGDSDSSSDSDEPSKSDSKAAGDSGGKDSNDPDWKPQSKAPETVSDVLESLKDDENLSGDVASMNDAYSSNDVSLPPYGRITNNDDEDALGKSKAIVDDIIRAFDMATSNCAPHWESQQRRGYIEPVRYATRQAGDMEFFRGFVDEGDPGHNIAVSLFLDISGSMHGTENKVGAAAWAVKTACDQLEIDCDVTLFNTQAYSLWSKNDRAPEDVPAIEANGGTSPIGAFEGILYEENEKKHHIVLVMTDGVWSGDGGEMGRYKHSNTTSVIFYYDGRNDSKGVVPNQRLASSKGADEGYDIGDLMDIPQVLESILIGLN